MKIALDMRFLFYSHFRTLLFIWRFSAAFSTFGSASAINRLIEVFFSCATSRFTGLYCAPKTHQRPLVGIFRMKNCFIRDVLRGCHQHWISRRVWLHRLRSKMYCCLILFLLHLSRITVILNIVDNFKHHLNSRILSLSDSFFLFLLPLITVRLLLDCKDQILQITGRITS